MVDYITTLGNIIPPKDRNGVKIEPNAHVLFKNGGAIGIGKVLGYTNNMKYIYIISSSFYKVELYKRAGKNVIIGKNLDTWNNSSYIYR